jgi:FKBP-type peptidyl-prolyl cis-trans isomerase FkpA
MKHLFACFVLITFGGAIFFFSCAPKPNEATKTTVDPRQYNENLQEANKIMAGSEEIQIDDYVARMGWKMSKTPTGLRYWIYEAGNGKEVVELSIVRFNSRVELINGFVCYDSKHEGYEEIQLGRSTAPGGLEEGLALLREGDKAKLILPSHMAFGLLGDQNKIPTKAILIYDIEILSVRNN